MKEFDFKKSTICYTVDFEEDKLRFTSIIPKEFSDDLLNRFEWRADKVSFYTLNAYYNPSTDKVTDTQITVHFENLINSLPQTVELTDREISQVRYMMEDQIRSIGHIDGKVGYANCDNLKEICEHHFQEISDASLTMEMSNDDFDEER